MKRKIIINYLAIILVILASIGVCAYVMVSRLSKEKIESLDILLVVGTPFFLFLFDFLIGKTCLTNIKSMYEFIKIPLDNRNDVVTVGKAYKVSIEYIVKISSSIAFFGIIIAVILFALYFMNKTDILIGIGLSCLLIVVSIISLFVFLYYNKLNKLDEYELGKRYINILKNNKNDSI